MSVVTLSADGVEPVVFDGSQEASGFILRGLSGWLGTSSAKVDLVERAAGDGAHDVMDAQILYAARTVSVDYRLLPAGSADRDGLLAMQAMIRRMLHRTMVVRVQDAGSDLTATGYVDSIDVPQTAQNVNRQYMEGQINIVCPRPELLSTQEQAVQLICDRLDLGRGGLSYNPAGMLTRWEGEPNNSVSVLTVDTLEGTRGLRYPLTYRIYDDETDSSTGMIRNAGTSRAYPVFEVCGDLPDGIDLVFPGTGLQLACAHAIHPGTPLILDSRTRTASIHGRDVSDTLINRGFPTIQPASSLAMRVHTLGDGWVNVTSHDTYM